MHISEINIYPIKSLKGISLDSAKVEERGLRFDRRWMLTTPDGMFFTQREFPRMATVAVRVDSGRLIVESETAGVMSVPFEPDRGERQRVTVWQSVCDGVVYKGAVSEWFSDAIGTKCQLVLMPDGSKRHINQIFDRGDDIVSFADGYPLMLIGEESLAELNARLSEAHEKQMNSGEAGKMPAFQALPMNRFRPNLVASGSDAFAEDDWRKIRIGEAVFNSTKPCARCVMTTVDQAKGEFYGKEPLKTLASYRMAKDVMPERIASLGVGQNDVLFGQNLVPETPGSTINVGDRVDVLENF
jgi:uncharacterized protein YcbX